MFGVLTNEDSRGGDQDADGSKAETQEEVGASPGKERDGGEDDGDLKQGFAEIIASGLTFCVSHLMLILVGGPCLFGKI